jgi:hypothetical protein
MILALSASDFHNDASLLQMRVTTALGFMMQAV